MSGNVPPEALVAEIARLRRAPAETACGSALSDAYREILRGYRALRAVGEEPSTAWRTLADDALNFLGGQSDRLDFSLGSYDHGRFGPFLGISNEGGGAATISEAAYATPKADALGDERSALNVGVAVDGEVLGAVGEVPVGPDEYADIWRECSGRTLMTTNVGSRANVRLYRLPPVVTVAPDEGGGEVASANFSVGSHDEWAILRLVNAERRKRSAGPDKLDGDVGDQLAAFFDGVQVSLSASEAPVSRGYAV